MIAEIDNDENVSEIINNLKNEYNAELESGLMDVIVPEKDFYPDFKSVGEDTIFHDPKDRITWRKKQNYDYSYLMSYAYNRGDYYLQLEDDLITSPGFLQKIHKFIQKKESDQWIELDFTDMGFIGKMFHNRHLSILANYWIMYADIMPCDLLLYYWQRTMKCDPGGAWETCLKTLKTAIGVYPENLWHHIGKESSLAGKVLEIKLTRFIEVTKHDNPKANVSTTMTSSLNKFTFDKVYDGISIYRGETLNCESCFISIVFKEPLNLKKFRIKSGSSLYLSDTIPMNSLIQIKTVDTADSMPSFITIEKSKTKHISGIIDSKYGPVKEFRLSITSGYKNPIVIRDIKLEY